MYNESIRAENKIITSSDLADIFRAMGETLNKYKKISQVEESQNRMLDYSYQKYTFKDSGSKMKTTVDFYDNTNISFDTYESFSSIFFSRCEEIKRIDLQFTLSYEVITPQPYKSRNYYLQHIHMTIKEDKLDISLDLKSEDPKLNDIYELIKNKVLNAPEKYDDVIRNKSKIENTVGFSVGLIPGIVISTLMLFIPVINNIFFHGYIVYPLVTLMLSYLIGSMFGTSKLERYYTPILPSKKSVGYDSNYNRIYKEDIDSFIGSSEILIGNKVNNLDNRNAIREEYYRQKTTIGKKLLTVAVISVLVIVIGLFI